MIPHKQTDTSSTSGTCFSTCVQSILNLPLDSTPHFVEEDGWPGSFVSWLEDNMNLSYVEIFTTDDGLPTNILPHNSWCILVGKSPSGQGYHAVVGKTVLKGDKINLQYIHDPHPRDEFLQSVEIVGFFVSCIVDDKMPSGKDLEDWRYHEEEHY